MMLPIHHPSKAADMRTRLAGLRRDSHDARRWRRWAWGTSETLAERRPLHTAYHEAGHAVIGRKLGAMILAARCDPHGRVITNRAQYLDAMIDIIFSLAGGVAERRRVLFGDFKFRNSVDDRQVRTTLRLMSPCSGGGHRLTGAQRLILRRAELATRGLVARHWREIDAFAKLLYKRGHVSFPLRPA